MATRRQPPEPTEDLTAIPIPLPTRVLWKWQETDAGIPKAQITNAGLQYISTMSQAGRSTVTIAREMNMQHSVFRSCMKRQEEVDEAIVQGQHCRNDEISDILMQMARSGNVQAAMFIAKAQCGWRENDVVQQTAQVVVQMPAPMTMEQFLLMRKTGVTPMQLPEAEAKATWTGDSVIDTKGEESPK